MTSHGHERAKPLRTGDPHQLGGYRILGRLGRGGMGTVYLAESGQGRHVAIKLIHPDLSDDENFRRRFAREVHAARSVARFSTAAVLDAQLDTEPLYIVSEYVPGPTLAHTVDANGPMDGGTLESLAMGVAAALAAIHGAGVIHRDLKPGNVLLSTVGPKVIDFGIARALDDDNAVTRSSQLMGTPAYLAPEIILGEQITPASDIFSWGCLVAFAGTGKAPFDAPSIPAVLHQISTGTPDFEGLDDTLHELVAEATRKDPHQRPTAQRLLDRLIGHEAPTSTEIDQTVVRSWTPPVPLASTVPAHEEATLKDVAEAPPAPEDPSGPQPPYGHRNPPPAPGPPPGDRPGHSTATDHGPHGPAGSDPGASQGGRSGGGRRTLAIGAGTGALLLLVGGGFGLYTLFGTPPPVATTVYSDDFANPESGWDGNAYEPGESVDYAGYYKEHYMLRASPDQERSYEFAPSESELPDKTLVSVETEVSSGPEYGTYGLICFHQTVDDVTTYYEATVRIDGQGGTIRRIGGEDDRSELASTLESWDSDPVRLHLACEFDEENETVRLRLWAGDTLVTEATDDDPVPKGNTTGLTVGRPPTGGGDDTVVAFDDYDVGAITEE